MKSIISKSIFDQMSETPSLRSSGCNQCVSITGQSLKLYGEFTGQLECSPGSCNYKIPFVVCDNVLPPLQCILGWDFLLSNCLELALHQSNYLLIGPHGHTPISPIASSDLGHDNSNRINDFAVFEQSTHRGPVPLNLVGSVTLPARTEAIVITSLPRGSRNTLGMVAPICNDSFPSCLHPAYSVCVADNRSVPVRLLNTGESVVELQKGQHIADFCPVTYQIPSSSPPNNSPDVVGGVRNASDEVHCDLKAALSPSLPDHDKSALMDTLLQYVDVFENSLGHTTVLTHAIDTGDSPPICQAPRRLPYAYRQDADSQIAEMLQHGVMQPSLSPWASP